MRNRLGALRIVSGGQTGVDRATLDFALKNHIDCFGWCPKGRLAEDGVLPDFYPLKETKMPDSRERTFKNVEISDGTLIFLLDKPDEGTVRTIDYAELLNKPLYIVHLNMNREDQETGILSLWDTYGISVMNIAGPRESHSPGIYTKTKAFLSDFYLRLTAGSS
jgi:hypothetical protein